MDERSVELASASCRGDHGYRETTATVKQSRFGDGQGRRATIGRAACPWKGRNVDISDEIRTGSVFTQMRPSWVPQDKLRVHRIQFCFHAPSHRTPVALSRDVIHHSVPQARQRSPSCTHALSCARMSVERCMVDNASWDAETAREILVPCSLFLVPCNPVRRSM